MISRYTLYDIGSISKRFSISAGLPKGIRPHYNISPTVNAPVILSNDGELSVRPMSWGLVPEGTKGTNSVFRYKTFNIPSEKILTRHSWERAVRERRCLVPANGFYLLSQDDEKSAHYVELEDKSLFSFAGVYNSWTDSDNNTHETFSIITINDDHTIPGGIAPVVLKQEDETRWLTSESLNASDIYDMLRSIPSDELHVYEVGPDIHSPKPNNAGLLKPLT